VPPDDVTDSFFSPQADSASVSAARPTVIIRALFI
jgi:hypothetical protein